MHLYGLQQLLKAQTSPSLSQAEDNNADKDNTENTRNTFRLKPILGKDVDFKLKVASNSGQYLYVRNYEPEAALNSDFDDFDKEYPETDRRGSEPP